MSRPRSSGRTRARRGHSAERRVAKKMGCKSVGGPRRPDITCRTRKVENKHWKSRVHSGVIRKAKRQGISQVNASGRGGFTKPAKQIAKRLGIKTTRRRA